MKRYGLITLTIFTIMILVSIVRLRIPPLVAYLLAINIASFSLYGLDKLSAMMKWQRAPEKLLHIVALAGGSPMALLAQQFFNHKISKQEFLVVYWIIVLVQLVLIYAIFYTDFLKQIF